MTRRLISVLAAAALVTLVAGTTYWAGLHAAVPPALPVASVDVSTYRVEAGPLGRPARGRLPVEEALRLMIRDTTRYAKRQMTWFSREREIRWLDVDRAGGVAGAAGGAAARSCALTATTALARLRRSTPVAWPVTTTSSRLNTSRASAASARLVSGATLTSRAL